MPQEARAVRGHTTTSTAESAPPVRADRGVICVTWSDHQFGGPRLVDAGTLAGRGAYERWRLRCDRCGRTVDETKWTPRDRRPFPIATNQEDV